MIEQRENISYNVIENEYSKSISLAHRKKFAQFFTPFPIAEVMAKWILENKQLKTVLEPAFGLGVFSRALLNHNKNIEITGFEIDETIFDVAKQHFPNAKNINFVLQDYMYNDWENKYDGIICNPPYFKFHDYDNKNILKEVETHLHCKLNGFTNLYPLFLLKSIHQLAENGRCAYIIPSEFLNSDYGKLVKNYLINSKTLRHIIVINFEENVFDDALTTASILLCANDNLTDKVQFTNIHSLKELSKITQLIDNYPHVTDTKQSYKFSTLNPEIKWKAYYQPQNGIKFKHLVPFSRYAKVVRGIATGANDYFTFNLSKAKIFAIEEKYLLPCICKATDTKTPFFTLSDFEILKSKDKNMFLLNVIDSNNKKVDEYLKKGIANEIDKRFLTANRNPWYALENRPPAPIWVSVFNRTGLRFIRNEANISNLTVYHCIYPKQNDLLCEVEIDLLFAYLLTNTAKQIFEDNGREYGNGLQKFEPNDLNKGMMLDLGLLNGEIQQQILALFKHFRLSVIENKKDYNILDKIDKIFIDNYLDS